jgi:hypothetical protein
MPSLTRPRVASAFLPTVQCDTIQEDSWREHFERASVEETSGAGTCGARGVRHEE